jgi:hypothetical protein
MPVEKPMVSGGGLLRSIVAIGSGRILVRDLVSVDGGFCHTLHEMRLYPVSDLHHTFTMNDWLNLCN